MKEESTQDNLLELSTETLQEFKFKLNGELHILRELDGKQRDAYVSKTITRVKLDKTGATQSANMDGFQAELIQLSLHKAADDSVYPLEVIKKWPASVQSTLYKKARLLSGLRSVDSEDESAKND